MKKNHNIISILIGLFIVLFIWGCGGGGSTSSDGNVTSKSLPNGPDQGSLAVFITDGPADPDLFSSIYVTISQAVLVSDDGVIVPLYNGDLKTVDLMNLRHNAIPLSYGEGVPAGRYCEIRLTIDDVELELADGGSVYPDVPAGGILSLIPDDCFYVATGQVVHVELDLDIGKSIYEEDGKYLLRPVFYVNIYIDSNGARLLKLEGIVTEINTLDEQILVCDAVPVYRRDYDGNHAGCAWVQVTDDTGYFNNTAAYAGVPRPLSELLDLSMLDEPIAVVGNVDGFAHGYLHLDIPDGQLPPPGECKLWDPDEEPGHQPPPKSCDYLIDIAPADSVVVDHDGRILLDRRGLMSVNALAVEHGSFLQIDGDVETAVVVDEFTMNIAPGEPVVSVDPFPVRLQEAPVGGNGTRIISKTGELLIADDIDEEEDLTVDAVLINDAVNGAYLRSAVIVLDNSGVVVQCLSGTVTSAEPGNVIVNAPTAEDNPCADAAGDVTVFVDVETSFLTVIITDTTSDTAMGGELSENQRVDVYGSCELSGIFQADQIIIIDDQRT